MKILRVRRGFSTNCSGANEYFPPSNTLAPPTDESPDGGPWTPTPNTQVVFRWVTFMPDGAPPPLLRQAMNDSSSGDDADVGGHDSDSADGAPILAARARSDAGVNGEAGSNDAGAVSTPANQVRGFGGVGLVLFVVLLGALALFGLERFGRGLWGRLKKGDHDDTASS